MRNPRASPNAAGGASRESFRGGGPPPSAGLSRSRLAFAVCQFSLTGAAFARSLVNQSRVPAARLRGRTKPRARHRLDAGFVYCRRGGNPTPFDTAPARSRRGPEDPRARRQRKVYTRRHSASKEGGGEIARNVSRRANRDEVGMRYRPAGRGREGVGPRVREAN